jgi:hypothetical protein
MYRRNSVLGGHLKLGGQEAAAWEHVAFNGLGCSLNTSFAPLEITDALVHGYFVLLSLGGTLGTKISDTLDWMWTDGTVMVL